MNSEAGVLGWDGGGRSHVLLVPMIACAPCSSCLAQSTVNFLFISLHFERSVLLVFPSEGHMAKQGRRRPPLPRSPIPTREGPDLAVRLCQGQEDPGRGCSPVPAAQPVTPDQAQQLPWQPLLRAPWRPRVTTADATSSSHAPSPSQHTLTQQRPSRTRAASTEAIS